MEKINLELRLTHKYVGEWDHLDQWDAVGTAVLTPPKCVREPEDFDDGGEYVRWATIPRGQPLAASARALEDSLSKHGCSHEYDCCGCASYRTEAIHRHGRRMVLKTSIRYNY
jgi:hypothetical protein